jgi:hypothetical protein
MHTIILSDSRETLKELVINIPTNKEISVEVGVIGNLTAARVWPSSIVLAIFLLHHKEFITEKWIFELGSGISIPSMAAILSGAAKGAYLQEMNSRMLLDMQRFVFRINNLKSCVHIAANDLEKNHNCQIIQCPFLWGEIPDLTSIFATNGYPSLFIAADCIYAPDDLPRFFQTISILLNLAPGTSFVTAFQDRGLIYPFDELLQQVGLKLNLIPLFSFGLCGMFLEKLYEHIIKVVDDFPSPQDCGNSFAVLEICRSSDDFKFSIL